MIFALNCILIILIGITQFKAQEAEIKFSWYNILMYSTIGVGVVWLNGLVLRTVADIHTGATLGYLLLGSLASNLLFISAALRKARKANA